MGQRRRVWIGSTLLAEETGLHIVTVKESLGRLRRLGFIAVEGRTNRKRVNIYLVSLDGGFSGDGQPVDSTEMQTALNVQPPTSENEPSNLTLAATGKAGHGSLETTLEPSENIAKTQAETSPKNGTIRQVSSDLHSGDGSLQATMTGGQGSLQATMRPSEDGAKIQTGTPSNLGGGSTEREYRSIEREKENSELGKVETSERLHLGKDGEEGKAVAGGGSPRSSEGRDPLDWRQALATFHSKLKGRPRRETILAQIQAVEVDMQATETELARLRNELATAHPSRKDAIERQIQELAWELRARISQLQTLRGDLAQFGAEGGSVEASQAAEVAEASEVATVAATTSAEMPPRTPSSDYVTRVANMTREELEAEKAGLQREKEAIAEQLMDAWTKMKNAKGNEAAEIGQRIEELNGQLKMLDLRLGIVRQELGKYVVPGRQNTGSSPGGGALGNMRLRVQRCDWPEVLGRGKRKAGKEKRAAGARGKRPAKYVILASARV